eukprot:4105844-Amphidinium_carterae.1
MYFFLALIFSPEDTTHFEHCGITAKGLLTAFPCQLRRTRSTPVEHVQKKHSALGHLECAGNKPYWHLPLHLLLHTNTHAVVVGSANTHAIVVAFLCWCDSAQNLKYHTRQQKLNAGEAHIGMMLMCTTPGPLHHPGRVSCERTEVQATFE